MHGIKASRQIFLFERGVIIAKRKEDGMLSCKVYIPVSYSEDKCVFVNDFAFFPSELRNLSVEASS